MSLELEEKGKETFTIPLKRLWDAMRFLEENVDESIRDDIIEFEADIDEKIRNGEVIDMREVAVTLLELGVDRSIVEEFLKIVAGNRDDAEVLVAETMSNAMREYWRRVKRGGEEEE